jgi:uncharacterized protein YegL
MGDAQDMEQFKLQNSFSFSGQRIGGLGATEFTVASLAVDKSGSVSAFKVELEKCMGEVVKACRKSPRADNMMLRTTAFDHKLEEVNGFKTLNNINPDDYTNSIHIGGTTALHDAALEASTAMMVYAESMVKQDFSVNGILIVVTDGDDNASISPVSSVRLALANAVKDEKLESLVSILVGVNITDPNMKKRLDSFHQEAGFTQFISLDDASEKTLAKLAQFISKSISAQSQALGTGGPSKSLTF